MELVDDVPVLAGQERAAEARLEEIVVGLESADLALVPPARAIAVEVERADRSADVRGQSEHRADGLVTQLGAQLGPARLGLQILGHHARVEDERIDARPLTRRLVRVLETARDIVARCDIAQVVAVLGDQHQPDARACEHAGRAADDALDPGLQVDAVAVRDLELDQALRESLLIDVSRCLTHPGIVSRTPASGTPELVLRDATCAVTLPGVMFRARSQAGTTEKRGEP